uniref:EGF-like domain-containing protein n=1 Tax=Plectus sambesii TaxID=2011161 RepID=A0A914XBC6_9BILA
MMNAKTFVLLAVIAVNSYAIPIVSDLLSQGKCDKEGETDCGLVAVSLRCEKTGCESANVCANVCTGVLDSVIGTLTDQCVCKQGYYRDQNGLCVSLQTCLDATVGGPNILPALPEVSEVPVQVPDVPAPEVSGEPQQPGLFSGVVPGLLNGMSSLLNKLYELLGGVTVLMGGGAPEQPLPLPSLDCLTEEEMKQKCSLLQAITRCENTSCNSTAVCVDVCLNLLNNVVALPEVPELPQVPVPQVLQLSQQPQLPLPAVSSLLDCLTDAEIKEKCDLLNVVARCENTDCNNAAVCVDVCLRVPLVNDLLKLVTGQCVCKQGYYKDQRGTCVSLQTCLNGTINASG